MGTCPSWCGSRVWTEVTGHGDTPSFPPCYLSLLGLHPTCGTHRLAPTQVQCHALQAGLAIRQPTLAQLGQHSKATAVTGLQNTARVLVCCQALLPHPHHPLSSPVHTASPRWTPHYGLLRRSPLNPGGRCFQEPPDRNPQAQVGEISMYPH